MAPSQCHAARVLLNWSVEDLANESGVDVDAVKIFESSVRKISDNVVIRMQATLENAGVVFLLADYSDGAVVRLRE